MESTEIHGKENPNQLPLAVSFPGATPARRVGSFRGYAFVMILLAVVIARGVNILRSSGNALVLSPMAALPQIEPINATVTRGKNWAVAAAQRETTEMSDHEFPITTWVTRR